VKKAEEMEEDTFNNKDEEESSFSAMTDSGATVKEMCDSSASTASTSSWSPLRKFKQ
jgi:hypothetical protein